MLLFLILTMKKTYRTWVETTYSASMGFTRAEPKIGDKVKGKVVVMADYGAFVEIATGVEGLIHVSEMSWSQHLSSAQEFLKVGDTVEAVILTLDREERKMSLGMKQLKADPWAKN